MRYYKLIPSIKRAENGKCGSLKNFGNDKYEQ